MNTTDELAMSPVDKHHIRACIRMNCVSAGVRVGRKVPPCVWGECDFHVNWLHVSRIRPMHWRLNGDFDVNRQRRWFTQNIRMGVCVCVCVCT